MELDATRRAILAADGHLLIEGGPGSGKTTIALLKAARMLATLEPEQQVVFLSFSRAAVRQISDRVSAHLPRGTHDRLEVRTFHAFFLDFVRAHGPLLTGTPSMFLPPDAANQRKAEHDGDWDAEEVELARRGIFVFDQLAATSATLLERSPALRRLYSDSYPLVIVDEFQDTNVDQWRVIQAMSKGSTIICLADPDQRIYEGFIKGVDDSRLQQAVETLAPRRFDLAGDNHRSAGNGILDYANAVLHNRPVARPNTVEYYPYNHLYRPEQASHYVILSLQNQLTQQLARQPTIALLAPTSTFVAGISEWISEDRLLNGHTLPAIDHELVWDPGQSAAAGYVVASILEWPTLPRTEAIIATLRSIADFYRIKAADRNTQVARSAVAKTEGAINSLANGKTPRIRTGKEMIEAYDAGLQFTGYPVTDWQLARSRLSGSQELSEIFSKARLLRLLHATDSLAWGLSEIWDGAASYPGAADTVRRILTDELISGRPAEPHAVTLMNMHKSKGKEFDAVIIVDAPHNPKLLDPEWDPVRITRQRRVLRVAITRARHKVAFVRPTNATPLLPAAS